MSFEYNGFIHRDLEPQVRYDAEQIQLLKQEDQKIYETISTLPLGGEKVSLTFPAGASEGTITAEQLAVLQASESNYIEMVNDKELYYLNDNGHTDGYLTYSHVGIENSKATIKTLTITVSAKSFVIVTTVVPTESGGGKIYRHNIYFFAGPPEGYRITVYTTNATPYTPETFFADSDNGSIYCCGTAEISSKIYPIYMTVISDTLKRIIYINSDGGQTSKDINVSQLHGSDTVHEV